MGRLSPLGCWGRKLGTGASGPNRISWPILVCFGSTAAESRGWVRVMRHHRNYSPCHFGLPSSVSGQMGWAPQMTVGIEIRVAQRRKASAGKG